MNAAPRYCGRTTPLRDKWFERSFLWRIMNIRLLPVVLSVAIRVGAVVPMLAVPGDLDSLDLNIAGVANVAAPAETAKSGYIGQLYEITGLMLNATPLTINENGTRQLNAAQLPTIRRRSPSTRHPSRGVC